MQSSKFTFVNSTYMYNDCKYNLVALCAKNPRLLLMLSNCYDL